jgi:hypothetical protein
LGKVCNSRYWEEAEDHDFRPNQTNRFLKSPTQPKQTNKKQAWWYMPVTLGIEGSLK